MKSFSYFLAIITLVLFTASLDAQTITAVENTHAPKTVKVLSYNIHHGADKNNVNTLDSMGAFIRLTGADIVCLQEVDSVCKRSGNRNQTEVLAAAAGMQGVFAQHFPFENGAYGNSLLSKYPIKNVKVYRLPIEATGQHSSTAMLTAEIQIDEQQTISIAVVHLDYRSQASRIKQSLEILKQLQQHQRPVVLAGDMNGYPGSPEVEVLTGRFRETSDLPLPTYPVDKPQHQIDYILFDDGLVPVKYETFDVQYSDHLPIMRTIILPGNNSSTPAL